MKSREFQIRPTPPLRDCPHCGARDYEYGWAVSEVIADALSGTKELKLSWAAGLRLFRTVLIGSPLRIIRFLIQRIEQTPLLICQYCRTYITACPRCHTYTAASARPEMGELVACPHCKVSFITCERSRHFDRLLNKNPIWSYWSKAIFWALVGWLFIKAIDGAINLADRWDDF